MATEPPVVFKDLPDTTTPLNAATLNTAMQGAYGNALEAEAAAALAQQYAEQASAPADDQIADLVATPGSATRGQLDGRYASATAFADLAATAMSTEDAFATVALQTTGGTWSNTADVSAPIFAAPYPMRVRSLALVTWTGAAITTSDTAYWRVVLRKAPAAGGAAIDIAYKTTRVTDTGGTPNYPAGSTWTPRVAWTFDTAQFGTAADLAAGDILYVATLPVGTPGAIAGSFTATVGYQPL
ncbi:hypothetical protein MHY85_05055 [Cellulomonas sp. ACRRI]|uniref:hypothetical protein n=1 Tax=Cellulomonas sp. ACRRI TaxID=2918188 RepID=UPI001EF226B0|nr:hypothetical protein [Cellulomonas sp. ACRRI]MCG7285343.1 hypothetical protein [Cellulomonas sp. ACRRI]